MSPNAGGCLRDAEDKEAEAIRMGALQKDTLHKSGKVPKVLEGTDPSVAEYPMGMDRIMKALGATPIDWDYKVCCCGAAHSLTRPDIVYEMSGAILENAKIRGADIVAVACPLCHTNLDGRQTQMDPRPEMPALYFTQLMSVAFGMPDKAALGRNLIDPRPVLEEKGLL